MVPQAGPSTLAPVLPHSSATIMEVDDVDPLQLEEFLANYTDVILQADAIGSVCGLFQNHNHEKYEYTYDLIDSGTSLSLTPCRWWLFECEPCNIRIRLANGKTDQSTLKGKM